MKARIIKIGRALPWLLIAVFTALFYIYGRGMTSQELLGYTPKSYSLAALFFLVLFALKSLIVILPIPLIYISVGILFDPMEAIILNILGMAICTALPYWIGRWSGAGFLGSLVKKHPRLKHLMAFEQDNEFFLSFFVRAIGFLPCDIVSLALGSLEVNFKKYMAGTAIGMLPGLIASTLIGDAITDPGSPQFIVSSVLIVVIATVSALVYSRMVRSRRLTLAATDPLDLEHEE